MTRTIIKYLWLSLGFAFLISLNTYAIRGFPHRPQVVDVRVNPANLDHIFVDLFVQNSNDFLVELPILPAAESHDGGITFAIVQQRDITETFIENTLTGSVRYALIPKFWRRELWRSDDAGITWKETDLGKFLNNIEHEDAALWEKRRESNYFSLLPRLRWWKRIFKCVAVIYLLVTSVLIFRRSRFLCIVSLVKSIVVCCMFYIAFTLIHGYNCRIVSLSMGESVIGGVAGNILRNPSIFVSVLFVLLLFLPNSFTLLRAYLNKSLTKTDRIIGVWQLGAILLWLFFSFAIMTILLRC